MAPTPLMASQDDAFQEQLVSELAAAAAQLEATHWGPPILKKLGVSYYQRDPEQWRRHQLSAAKTQRDFADIFGAAPAAPTADAGNKKSGDKKEKKAKKERKEKKEVAKEEYGAGDLGGAEETVVGQKEEVADKPAADQKVTSAVETTKTTKKKTGEKKEKRAKKEKTGGEAAVDE